MNPAFSPSVSSAVAKWVIRPATRTPGPAAAAASTSASMSSGRAPSRPIPVSSFRWTGSGLPRRSPAAVAAATASGVHAVGSAPAAAARSHSSPVRGPMIRICAPIPASRSACASPTAATARAVAPPSRAARAAGTAPCP